MNSINNAPISFQCKSKNGIKVIKSIGENGERIIEAIKPNEVTPSFSVVQHPPVQLNPIDLGQGFSRVCEVRITDVSKDGQAPRQIMTFKNQYYRGDNLERIELASSNELTGRYISVSDYSDNKNLFNEASIVSANDYKDSQKFDYFNGSWIRK